MTKDKSDMRVELLELMQLKKDILSVAIAGSQVEKTQLEQKMKFYEGLVEEWAAEGEFQQSQCAANGTKPVKTEIQTIRSQIEQAQHDRLRLTVAMRSLSR